MNKETGCFTYELEQEISKLTEQNKEMLEALKEHVEYHEHMIQHYEEDCGCEQCQMLETSKAIIQKIEGE